jgi:hypothetical protein
MPTGLFLSSHSYFLPHTFSKSIQKSFKSYFSNEPASGRVALGKQGTISKVSRADAASLAVEMLASNARSR